MARAATFQEALDLYPELGLKALGQDTYHYYLGDKPLVVDVKSAINYMRTYEYCRQLVKMDRYEAAKDIAFTRNSTSPLPYDRLPFLALLTDPGHLIEVVNFEKRLDIVSEVRGRKVNFFYEEGERHLPVKPSFVGGHLRNNSLCQEDIKHSDFERAVMRSLRTPLSSQLISHYDAHLECDHLIKDFDALSAQRICTQQSLKRNVLSEWQNFAMPLAKRFRSIYQSQSPQAANIFAIEKGFSPVIRNDQLVTIKKRDPMLDSHHAFNNRDIPANIPILNYEIEAMPDLEKQDMARGWQH